MTTTYFTYDEDFGVTAFSATFEVEDREQEYLLQGTHGLLRTSLKTARIPERWPSAELMAIIEAATPSLADDDKKQFIERIEQRDYALTINYLATVLRHVNSKISRAASGRLVGICRKINIAEESCRKVPAEQ